MSSSENANNNNEQQNQQQPTQEQNTTAEVATAITETSLTKTGLDELLEKLRRTNDEEYVKQVIAMSDQDEYMITLNELDPSGKTEPDPIEPTVQRPVIVGTKDMPYKPHPITPFEYQRIEKLRAKFANEKEPDRDKLVEMQIAIYRLMAYAYLKMSPAEFDRLYSWIQLKMAVDASEYRAYKPNKK